MIEILHNKENTEKIEFVAKDGEEVLGRCAGSLSDGAFVIDELDCPDFFADGLIRAILNLADLHGITSARFDLPGHNELLRKLGFVKDDSSSILDISAFFGDRNCG